MPRLDKPRGCRSCAKSSPVRRPTPIRREGLRPREGKSMSQQEPEKRPAVEEPAASEEELEQPKSFDELAKEASEKAEEDKLGEAPSDA